ncbi:MAG: hypothetical protein ACRDP1_17600, partial [Nocardioidaceae bacterium]
MTAAVIVRQDWTGSGSPPGYNVWHCDAQAGSAESDAVGHLVTDLNTFYSTLMPFCATNYTWTVADRAYAVPPSTQEYAVTQTPHTGSQGDSSMPPQVALCIGWRTGVRSRSAFGR